MRLSEQEKQRRENLQKIRDLGIDPYPSQSFETSHLAREIKEQYKEENQEEWKEVVLSGRLMSRRIMGKASFAEIQDSSGRIQIYLNRDDLCPGEDKTQYNTLFKKLLDLGDIIGLKGEVFTTKVGELSIYVRELTLLSKSLRPLPVVKEQKDASGQTKRYDAFTDPEMRYRQRYVDLIVNPEVRKTFEMRSQLMNSMRDYLNEKGYLEVETPILQPIYGGAAAKPFTTHHNKLDMKLYLRIANELYLKRLIVGGYDGVYEFAKDFRNEGLSRFHNPEFTQIELYVAYKDYEWMMNLVEEMIEKVALDLHGSTKVQVGEQEIDFKRPWKRLSMYEAIEEYTGVDISSMEEEELRKTAQKLDVPIEDSMGKGKLIDELFGETVEKKLIQPTFITDYPLEMSPLAKKHPEKEGLVERFEAICNGKEFLNSFSELNDPIDQRKRFEEQLELGKRGDEEAMVLDEDFLRALEYGMPPTAGLGIGIDRLTMMMTNSESIQDVLFFPQMRPEKPVEELSEQDLTGLGVPPEWHPVILEMPYKTKAELLEAGANKVFNDMGGLRKKLKLDLKMPDKAEVEGWLSE